MTAPKHPVGRPYSEATPCPEMLSVITDPNLEVIRVTTDAEQVGDTRGGFFTPDSRFFLFKRRDSNHANQYWAMCDTRDSFTLYNVTEPEDRPAAPFVSRDGEFLYYFQDFSHETNPRIVLKKRSLRTFREETLTVFDKVVEGIGRRPRAGGKPPRGMTQGASLRADGRKVITGFNFVGDDGEDHFAPVIIDLQTLAVHGFEWEPYSWRVGGTYFRGSDPARIGSILMGKSHRSQHWDEQGRYTEKWHSDIRRYTLHVVSEEGNILGTVPIGGEGEGVDHPYWRGGRYEIVTHTSDFNTAPHWRGIMLCAEPIACPADQMYLGNRIPGGRRYELTRKFKRPDVCHMSWHLDGIHVACDTEGWYGRGTACPHGPAAFLYLGTVIEAANEPPYLAVRYLLHPRSSWNWAGTENCPELSPDLKMVMFNSDFLGKLGCSQVFAARGFTFPTAE